MVGHRKVRIRMKNEHKHNGGFVVSPERIAIIENEIEELFERMENMEKLMKNMTDFCHEYANKILEEPLKPFDPAESEKI